MMQSAKLIRLCLGVIASVAALAACGGGSGGSQNSIQGPSPGGVWRGTDSASGLTITGLVDETGLGEFIRADKAVFEAQVSTSSNNSISMDGQGYPWSSAGFPDGSQHAVWTVSGTIDERKSVSATTKFTTDGGTSMQGTLDLTFDALYDQPSALATVAGGYMDASDTEFLEIASDGSISGHVVTIGDFSGQISVIDPAYNLYRVQLTLTRSGGAAFFVGSGLATMDKSVSPSRLMIVGLLTESGGTFAWTDTWCTPAC